MKKPAFKDRVYAAVKKIPRGQTRTYKEIAVTIGAPKAYRAVASAVAKNSDKTVPCHRVIRSDGTIGEYNGLQGPSKRALLKKEGAL